MIKSSKYGLNVHLNENASYDELLSEIENKFQESANFFHQAKMAISFEGRMLTQTQEQEIIDVITKAAKIQIVCIIDNSKGTETTYKSIVDQSVEDIHNRDGQFYKGTLRKRQILESETSIIILGDVDYGATVASKGSIVVVGTIYGSVHAGITGDESAFIVALSMQPARLRIADVTAHRQLLMQQDNLSTTPKIAVVDGKRIYIDPLVY